MKILLLILCVFSAHLALSSEEETFNDEDRGAYLIYDCQKKHWSCVSGEKNQECIQKRLEDLKSKTTYHHSCATIEELPSKKGCHQRQLFYSTKNQGTTFCLKDEWKEKASF